MAFVDDELDATVSYEVDRHLTACPCCHAEAESIRAYDVRVREACRGGGASSAECAGARARLAAALAAVVAREGRRSRFVRASRRLGAVAALVLVVFGLVIGLMPGPAVADFATHHVLCLGMRKHWTFDRAELDSLCRAQTGGRGVIVSLEKAGYRLDEGAVCGVNGERFCHLVYRAEGRDPVSIFVGRQYAGWRGRLRDWERHDRDGPFEIVKFRCPAGTDYVMVGSPSQAELICEAVEPQIGR